MRASHKYHRRSTREAVGRPGLVRLESRVLFAAAVRTIPLTTDLGSGPAYDSQPPTDVAVDAAGDALATRQGGSAAGPAAVLEVKAGATTSTVLATFDTLSPVVGGVQTPRAHLVLDAAGDLFGVSHFSSDFHAVGNDMLWELPAGSGLIQPLAAFPAADGVPTSLVRDAAGNLFGTVDTADTSQGDTQYNGAVFEYPADGSGLVTTSLGNPFAATYAVAADAAGDLFGIGSNYGSDYDADDEFQLYEVAHGTRAVATVAALKLSTGVDDEGTLTADPPLGLTVDAGGDVVILTASGRVLEVAAGATAATTLGDVHGGALRSNPLVDGAGDVFVQTGSTADGYGLYEVPAGGGPTITVSAAIGTPAVDGGPAIDGSGNLYGTTDVSDGFVQTDTLFEVTGSGAVPLGTAATPTPTTSPTPSPTPASTPSGLTPVVSTGSLPSVVVAGTKPRGKVTVTLTNTTAAAIKGPAKISIGASAAGVNGTELGVVTRRVNLPAGGRLTVTLPVRDLPAVAGSYTVLATATDPSGTVITSATDASGPGLTVTAATVALSVSSVVASPSAVADGRAATIAVTLSNGGTVDSTGRLTISVGLSVDGGTTVIVPLASSARATRVAAAGAKLAVVRLRAKVPAGTAAGSYQLVATVATAGVSLTGLGTVPLVVG